MSGPDRATFRFHSNLRVRNYEIDWQGIVHNATYLQYFETGRIAYLQHLGVQVDIHTIQHSSKVVLVRNELDYRSPARFGELLRIHTRIAFIRNSSFAFEGIMEEETTGRRIAENTAFHVWLDETTDRPRTVPGEFRKAVAAFEGAHALIDWPEGSA
jgi:acyl-CoA thioester hydrolase